MVDNFEQIGKQLAFESDDIYYHLQIIRRGKDHLDLPSANRVIKTYYVCSKESLFELRDEIKSLCGLFQARAYINLNPKSIRKTSLLQLKYLSERIYTGDYKKIWKSWDTCAGSIKGEQSRWIVDIDIKDWSDYHNNVVKYINCLQPTEVTNKIITYIPTKSGWHLLTTPFNLQQFKQKFPDIDVHKNNPTILYVPN